MLSSLLIYGIQSRKAPLYGGWIRHGLQQIAVLLLVFVKIFLFSTAFGFEEIFHSPQMEQLTCEFEHWSLLTAKVKKCVELYLRL
jgi:hypothetical protein